VTLSIPCKGGPLDGQKVIFRDKYLLVYAARGGNDVYRVVNVGPCKIPVRYRYEGNFLVRFPEPPVMDALNKKEVA
jgi:hypothetical protein